MEELLDGSPGIERGGAERRYDTANRAWPVYWHNGIIRASNTVALLDRTLSLSVRSQTLREQRPEQFSLALLLWSRAIERLVTKRSLASQRHKFQVSRALRILFIP